MVGFTEKGSEDGEGCGVVEDGAEGNGRGLDGGKVWGALLVMGFRRAKRTSGDARPWWRCAGGGKLTVKSGHYEGLNIGIGLGNEM